MNTELIDTKTDDSDCGTLKSLGSDTSISRSTNIADNITSSVTLMNSNMEVQSTTLALSNESLAHIDHVTDDGI